MAVQDCVNRGGVPVRGRRQTNGGRLTTAVARRHCGGGSSCLALVHWIRNIASGVGRRVSECLTPSSLVWRSGE